MYAKNLYRLNISLLVIGALVAISSILLECIAGGEFLGLSYPFWVWLHIIVCLLCMAGIILHLQIHWVTAKKWLHQFLKQKNKLTRWLTWFAAITFLSGLVVAAFFCSGAQHNPLGGIHGKLGLIVILLTTFHVLKRFKWFRGRREGKAFSPVVDEEKCKRCLRCVKRCPAQVFALQDKQVIATREIFCLQCMKCVSHCPVHAIKRKPVRQEVD